MNEAVDALTLLKVLAGLDGGGGGGMEGGKSTGKR